LWLLPSGISTRGRPRSSARGPGAATSHPGPRVPVDRAERLVVAEDLAVVGALDDEIESAVGGEREVSEDEQQVSSEGIDVLEGQLRRRRAVRVEPAGVEDLVGTENAGGGEREKERQGRAMPAAGMQDHVEDLPGDDGTWGASW
jgi:hypothetical protein